MATDDEFLRALQATFQVEADEHVRAIGDGLLELEKTPEAAARRQIVERIFRAAHSLKGAARAVNMSSVEAICQGMEDIFALWKRQDAAPAPAMLDALHRSLDKVSELIAGPTQANPAPVSVGSSPPMFEVHAEPAAAPVEASTVLPLAEPVAEAPPAGARTEALAPAWVGGGGETVRISVSKLDARLLEAEEMLAAKLATGQRATDLSALNGQFEEWRKEWVKVQPSARALRRRLEQSGDDGSRDLPGLSRLIDFFDWSHDFLRTMEARAGTLCRAAEQDHLMVSKLVDDLLEDSKKLLMLPLSTLGGFFPKIVRDICRDQGKEAELIIRGEEVEIDKRILEEMKDPLVHLLRNSVDHGIEPPEERRRLGKRPRATIMLAVRPVEGSKVEIRVSDDGRGIDPEKVKASAIKHGRVSEVAAAGLNEQEALNLIFHSDVSTSPIITRLSGRGLGLAIVKEKAEKLGGRVAVESEAGRGSRFAITVPVALATFRGILVALGERPFVIPTTQVERVVRFKMDEVRMVEGRESLAVGGRATALVWLSSLLELEGAGRPTEPSSQLPAVLIGSGDERAALAVDAILGEQEVLVKRLTPPLVRVRNIAGATVLGSGQVAPILNVPDLLKSARRAGAPQSAPATAEKAAPQAKSILIAEDSITSRMLLKGILESAGYQVTTAVDGMAAFTALRAGAFDLLVSDVEMPRLNGFDLTARVRADRKLAELPVILVTALESQEHRERGIDVGANAYLVKSNFNQSDLLAAVRRLV